MSAYIIVSTHKHDGTRAYNGVVYDEQDAQEVADDLARGNSSWDYEVAPLLPLPNSFDATIAKAIELKKKRREATAWADPSLR